MRTIDSGVLANAPVDAGPPTRADADGARERLRALFVTQVALRNTTALRRFLVHVLGAIGGMLVISLVVPWVPRQALAWTWWVCGCAAALSAGVERQLRIDASRLLGVDHTR